MTGEGHEARAAGSSEGHHCGGALHRDKRLKVGAIFSHSKTLTCPLCTVHCNQWIVPSCVIMPGVGQGAVFHPAPCLDSVETC